jgi:molybdate transport system substrate-binding protein
MQLVVGLIKELDMKIFFSVLILVLSLGAQAQQFKLYAAAGVKLPMQALAQRFEADTGRSVELDFDTAGAAQEKFQKDPQAIFLITTQERMVSAQALGQLSGGHMWLLADTVAGIASSSPTKPKMDSVDDLRRALLSAKTIAFSDPARGATVGKHFAAMIRKLGIESEVLGKATLARDGVETMKLVQSGAVELGITQLSEVVQADASTLVGPFPGEFDLFTRYAIWVRSTDPLAQNFVALLRSEAGGKSFKANGLRPVP